MIRGAVAVYSPATLRMARRWAGLSMEALAERARAHGGRVTTGFVGMIETGRRQPTETNARAIAAAIAAAANTKGMRSTPDEVFDALFRLALDTADVGGAAA